MNFKLTFLLIFISLGVSFSGWAQSVHPTMEANKNNTVFDVAKAFQQKNINKTTTTTLPSYRNTEEVNIKSSNNSSFMMPPGCAIDLSPFDTENNVSLGANNSLQFSWLAGSGTPTSYDFYFGLAANQLSLLGNTTATSVTLNNIFYGTTQYWAVISKDATGDAVGCSVWSFTTVAIGSPPSCASTPISPTNGATNVALSSPEDGLTLTWTAPASGTAPTGYDVYLGTTSGSLFYLTTQTTATMNLSYLPAATTFYWRIVPRNNGGPATGCTEWTFTTAAGTAAFPEDFEGAFPPTGWTTFIGTNGLGTGENWGPSDFSVYEGDRAALVGFEDVTGGLAEDWMVTHQFTPTAGANILSFFQRQLYTTNYNNTYTVRVSTTSQTNPASFTTVLTQTEANTPLRFQETFVNLSAYNNTPIYVAFVMSNDDGDIWIIDEVDLVANAGSAPSCVSTPNPVNGATNVALGANDDITFTWSAPASGGTPSSYDLYIGTVPGTLNLIGAYPTNQATITGFANATTYYWQVIARNSAGNAVGCSTWSYTTEMAMPEFPEDFEGATFPPVGWASFDNGNGTGQSWEASDLVATPSGNLAAHIRYEAVPSGVAEDWLVTFRFTPTANASTLTMSHRQGFTQVYNSVYTIRVSTASQTNPADFAIIETMQEANVPTTFMTKNVNLSAYIGTPIYVAFVMSNNDGDDWFIDDVNVPGLALPIELLSFNGTEKGAINVLNWSTATEMNTEAHIVERSADGRNNWETVGKVASVGTSNRPQSYQLTDNAPLLTAYYRLRSVDVNGNFQLSNTILIERKAQEDIQVYPIPATDEVQIQFVNTQDKTVNISLTDVTGRVLRQLDWETKEGMNQLSINVNDLTTGIYLLVLKNGQEQYTQRIVKK